MAYHYDTVPVAFSIALAALLAGVSRATFRKLYLHSGLCSVTGFMEEVSGVGAGKVWCWELARALGRDITVEDVQQADKQLDKGRKWQKQYRARTQHKRTR
jgi:hypothetical protein